ncbi:MAG: DUF4287 domain-containing protein [Alphaproteobacteria bacterium]|nr:DUF4287 domain-containing protein [Alphaproteobacteria bacterium]
MADLSNAFRVYLDNAEKNSGKSIAQLHAMLKKSGLEKHGELLTWLKTETGLGHGHANAVVATYLKPGFRSSAASAKKPAVKK